MTEVEQIFPEDAGWTGDSALEVAIPATRYFEPAVLLHEAPRYVSRMPVTADGYVPLLNSAPGYPVDLVQPAIHDLGGGAVSLAFDRPFGFRMELDAQRTTLTTQKVRSLDLAVGDTPRSWRLTLETSHPLGAADRLLFGRAAVIFAGRCFSRMMRD